MTLAAVSNMVVSLAILGVFGLVVLNLDHMVHAASSRSSLSTSPKVPMPTRGNDTQGDARVAQTKFVTKDAALANSRRRTHGPARPQAPDNPFRIPSG